MEQDTVLLERPEIQQRPIQEEKNITAAHIQALLAAKEQECCDWATD